MAFPSRIQLKRTKGWRLPPDTVNVSRSGKWGNPFSIKTFGRSLALRMFEAHLDKQIDANVLDLEELRGKNLACWCGPDAKCHADILLERANRD